MATWRELASSNRSASFELLATRRWRSCTSRAYYAVYSEVTHGLRQAGMTMPKGRQNPKHSTLPLSVVNHLSPLTPQVRWRISGLIFTLYRLRIIADYRADMTLDETDAKIAIGLMTQCFLILRGVP